MRPHRVMRAVGTQTGATDLLDALACCECGICELFSCPMGLSPRRVNVYVKGLLRADGITKPVPDVFAEQTLERDYRRIAPGRFTDRWKLSHYQHRITEVVVAEPDRVVIPTRHGVGKAAVPCVEAGQSVATGEVIAQVPFGEVGALVHASIDGQVSDVTASHITITRPRSPR
jgi:Na+-translocating ferredoxin:NAD+ oxidoreductase RnfC subunit